MNWAVKNIDNNWNEWVIVQRQTCAGTLASTIEV